MIKTLDGVASDLISWNLVRIFDIKILATQANADMIRPIGMKDSKQKPSLALVQIISHLLSGSDGTSFSKWTKVPGGYFFTTDPVIKSNFPVVSTVSVKESLPLSIRFTRQAKKFWFRSFRVKTGFLFTKNVSMKVSNTYSKKGPLNDGHYVVILLLFCTFMNHLDDFGSCCENMAGFISPLSNNFNLKRPEYRYYWTKLTERFFRMTNWNVQIFVW